MIQLEIQKKQLENAKIQAETDAILHNAGIKSRETEVKEDTVDIKAFEAGFNSQMQVNEAMQVPEQGGEQ